MIEDDVICSTVCHPPFDTLLLLPQIVPLHTFTMLLHSPATNKISHTQDADATLVTTVKCFSCNPRGGTSVTSILYATLPHITIYHLPFQRPNESLETELTYAFCLPKSNKIASLCMREYRMWPGAPQGNIFLHNTYIKSDKLRLILHILL